MAEIGTKGVLGQAHAISFLQQSYLSSRIPHALLIHGLPGSGQLALALYTARLLQCREATDGKPCGSCNQCQKVKNGTHPDVHFLFPVPNLGEQKKKPSHFEAIFREALAQSAYMSLTAWLSKLDAEQKTPNISAEACRDALHELGLHRGEGNYKILIIWLPEFLGKEGNILLKEIEEPAPNTAIILATDNAEQILPTIQSRCQSIRLVPLKSTEVQDGLIQQLSCDPVLAEEVSWLSAGNMDLALDKASDLDAANSTQFLDWLRGAYQGDVLTMSQWADQLSAMPKNRQKAFLEYFMHVMQQSILVGVLPDDSLHMPSHEIAALHKLKPILDVDKLKKLQMRIDEDLSAMEQNANPKIVFMALTVYTHQVLRGRA